MTTAATLPDDRRLVVIQRNPTSGSGRGAAQLKTLIRQLEAFGFRVRMFANRQRLDEFVNRPDNEVQLRCLVAAGGDGTVSDVLNRHPQQAIAMFPLGTENLLARHLNIRRNGADVAAMIRDGRVQRLDVGVANDHSFLMMISAGVDSEIVRRMHATRKGNIGHLSYLPPVFRTAFSYRYPAYSVWVKDECLAEGTHVIATNIPEYGFRLGFSPDADPTDGLLDVRVFTGTGLFSTLRHCAGVRLGWKDRGTEVARFRLKEFELRSVEARVTQADGDPSPDCPVSISVREQALTVVVPAVS